MTSETFQIGEAYFTYRVENVRGAIILTFSQEPDGRMPQQDDGDFMTIGIPAQCADWIAKAIFTELRKKP